MSKYKNIMDIENKIPLQKITAPSLNSVEYANKLEGVFNNIEHNFNTLSNHDFVKGENGKSLDFREIAISDKNQIAYHDEETNSDVSFNELLKKNILEYFGYDYKKVISKTEISPDLKAIYYDEYVYDENGLPETIKHYIFSLWDNIDKEENNEKLQIIYKVNSDVKNIEDTPAASLYYVFIDGRFSPFAISKIILDGGDSYKDLKNLSCVVVYDGVNRKFKVLNGLFPTIYYNKTLGWCWKINGEETTYAVQILGDKSAETIIDEKFNELKERIDNIELPENVEELKSCMDKRFLEFNETINTKFDDTIKQTDEKIVELTESFQNKIDELKEYDNSLNASKIYLSPCTELGPDELTSKHSIQYTLENVYSYIEKYENKISELESKISELENTINKNHPENPEEDEEGIEVVNEDEI